MLVIAGAPTGRLEMVVQPPFIPFPRGRPFQTFSLRNEILERDCTVFNVVADATFDYGPRVVIEKFHQK
jgi:hypothetical protein